MGSSNGARVVGSTWEKTRRSDGGVGMHSAQQQHAVAAAVRWARPGDHVFAPSRSRAPKWLGLADPALLASGACGRRRQNVSCNTDRRRGPCC